MIQNLTAAQLDALKQALTHDLCRESFHFFVKTFWSLCDGSEFKDNWHIRLICQTLERVERGEIQHIYICVPPGST